MGMPVRAIVRDRGAHGPALDGVFAWLRWVDATFSTYDAGSEISRWGRGELALRDAHALVRDVLGRCERLRADTGGAFDIRFRPGAPPDPSGLVKGWAVERAGARLAAAGARDFCLDAGGDVLVRGGPWRIGIRHPRRRDRLAGVLALRDGAVATSGAYERGAHIRDPRTGRAAGGRARGHRGRPGPGHRRRVRDGGVRPRGRGAGLDRRPGGLRRDDDPPRRPRAVDAGLRAARRRLLARRQPEAGSTDSRGASPMIGGSGLRTRTAR